MPCKIAKLLLITVLSIISTESYSQTINKYIILHKNRKNDSVIKPSPLSSGYEKNTAIEFSYEPEPTAVMKKRIKRIFGDTPSELQQDIDENQDNYDILGNSNQLFQTETSTLLEELREESISAIAKQEKKALEKLENQRKQNIASYAASVEAKIKRDREAALNPVQEEEVWSEFSDIHSDPTDEVYEENNEDSIILITDPSGKINRITTHKKDSISSDTASTTPDINSTTPQNNQ